MSIHRNSDLVHQQSYRNFIHPRYWPTWLMLACLWLLTRLPMSVQLQLGAGLGWLAYHLVKSRRRVTEVNIRMCFPELSAAEQQQLIKDIFISYGKGLMETAMSWFLDPRRLADKTIVEGEEILEEARRDGRGVILAGGHFAILDLASALFSLHNTGLEVVQRSHDNPLFNLFMTRARERNGHHCLSRKDLRGMIRMLKKGKLLWYAPDQDYGRRNSVFVPFFNIATATITSTTRLAQLSGATVVPCFAHREKGGYVLKFYPPWPKTDDDVENARLYNQFLEQRVREHPDQYLWLHKRFKTRPEGEPGFYR
ncbi:LpxL/LpxP family Kdo(2)-lipid IV(A) lauroyl/palmitoleoyl acyltransferase [Gynuella sunshinyii]|nr:LpxL/LpxP family Kdo(2)-lipid IV(A) lauroyl/palmitoleoyl acyltransferase [Gynuella sunshinyii]